MARSLSERAHAAVETLQHVPVRVIDQVYIVFGTLAAAWLAFLLVYQLATQGWSYLWAFIPFWLLVTYLILPRLHALASRIYLPGYFIGRTRTREGVLGDPVNLALRGTEQEIHTAMLRAGWRRADPLTLFSGWRIVAATLRRRSYAEAPVSSLYLFTRRQTFTYQQEVAGNPSKRHHVRFWPTPDGWRLPGGRQVEWLAAGTFDRAVGLSLFTFQVTHRIDSDVDAERDHILATLTATSAMNDGITVEHLHNFSSGYHHRNGGGDRIRTDGDLPIVDLRLLRPPSPETLAAIETDDAEANYRRPIPLTMAFAVAMMVLRVVVGAVTFGTVLADDGGTLVAIPSVRRLLDSEVALDGVLTVSRLVLAGYLLCYAVLAIQVYRGRRWARTCALLLSTIGVCVWALLWWFGAPRGTDALSLLGTALEILVILALASDSARIYIATRGGDFPDRAADAEELTLLPVLENEAQNDGHDDEQARGDSRR